MTRYLRPDFRRQLHSARRWAGRLCLCTLAVVAMSATSLSANAQQVSERIARVQSLLSAESGYRLSVFAEVPNARTIAVAPELGGIFVGTRGPNLYFVRDEDSDGVGEEVNLIADDFKQANGIVYKPGTLFVADQHRIVSYDLANFDGERLGPPRILFTNLPDKSHHGWRYATLSPNGDRLFVAVGAPCNICKVSGLEGTIISIPVNGARPKFMQAGFATLSG